MEASDGWICARRLLARMAETQDLETRRSLWRAACKYMRKDLERTAGLETCRPLPRVVSGGLVGSARDGKG